ncbi:MULTISPECIES: sodium-dependent transporter [Bacillaceae]|uniref:sodium-dependent transporter n=1 Tax=Bacillaceae TaxID=186817 RepID=UPI00104E54FE|nr:sodium-dependent transporter [Bacillus sp. CBEL-1]TDB49982.1 sodium-dependent transporter [Bacillus sp. CBEL-1]
MNQTNQWTSKLGFIMAAAGSAVGIGAIWKFPYVAGTSGGGAFLLIFLLFTLLIGLPLLLAEFVIGRSTQKDAISAYEKIAPGTAWVWIGRLGVITSFIILSFYSVVGGWIVLYLYRSVTNQLVGSTDDYAALFNNTISSSFSPVIGQLIFMIITIIVVAKGVQNGIEKANKYMFPALFILFIALIIRSLTLDGAMEGVAFFLSPDFTKLTSESILYAMGQSFFAISIGISIMVTYSSYLSKEESLQRSGGMIVGLNILVSIFAGLAIFPAVFSIGLEPTAGPGLLFNVLPAVFEQIPFGGLFLTIFLALFLFATLTSAFSLLETIVAAVTKGKSDKRTKASWVMGILIFIVGVPSALSFGVLSDITFGGKILFDALDYLTLNILMPFGALLISFFVSYRMDKKAVYEEFTSGSRTAQHLFKAWMILLRYIIPIVIIIVYLHTFGIL